MQRQGAFDYAEETLLTSSGSVEGHILRSSTGFDVRNNRLRTSSLLTSSCEDVVPDDFGFRRSKNRSRSGRFSKYSPTPSIKRGKAEKLLKEHGSPPGIRVTAGGRIVPDGLSPISSPQFDSEGAFKNGHSSRLNQAFGYNSLLPGTYKPLNGCVVDVGQNTLFQIIDNELCPVENHNGVLQLHMPAPNLPVNPGIFHVVPFPGSQTTFPYQTQGSASVGPTSDARYFAREHGVLSQQLPTEREVRVMEQAHGKLEQELRDLDRQEVLQRALLNPAKRAEIVRTRISLVNRLDESRRAVENVKRALADDVKLVSHRVPQFGPTLPSQLPVEEVDLNQSANIAEIERTHLANRTDNILRPGQHANTLVKEFQPDVPEFVPRRNRIAAGGKTEQPLALKERVGNVSRVSTIEADGSHGSNQTGTPSDIVHSARCMSLDGSVHLPRRSHAIEIKKPIDEAVGGEASHNTTSPNGSRESEEHGEILNFIPSPSLVAQMDNLVRSPQMTSNTLDESGMEYQQSSDSSVTTADFFPKNAYQYSCRKTPIAKRDIQVNLPAWMPKEGDMVENHAGATPVRLPNKFVFNDDSPPESYLSRVPLSMAQPRDDSPSRSQQQSRPLFCGTTVSSPSERHQAGLTDSAHPHRSKHPQQSSTSAPFQSSEMTDRPLSYSGYKLEESDSYWQGYRTGMRRDVLEGNKDEKYRVGYRDGLLHSSAAPESDSILDHGSKSGDNSRSVTQTQVLRAQCGNRIATMTKATSFPSFGGSAITTYRIPVPPANSLATTPTKYGSAKTDRSPVMEMSLDSPTARADFMSQPNVNFGSLNDRGASAKPSKSMPRDADCPSPLADRPFGRGLCETSTSTSIDSSFASRMQIRRGTYDQQRYQKSATSVAQTFDHARAQFPSQYDGSGDDDKELSKAPSELLGVASQSTLDKTKIKPSGSPVKARASAAVATMKQAAGMGTKREDSKTNERTWARKGSKKQRDADPASMSSPEKKKWRESWAKNFAKLKKEEEDEIDTYKNENPIN